MSSLTLAEKAKLERLFGMDTGYVLHFSDRTFGDFFAESVGVDIHSSPYMKYGDSKAKKLRAFWDDEPDAIVGQILLQLIEICRAGAGRPPDPQLLKAGELIAKRLLSGSASVGALKEHAIKVDAAYLSTQIARMEAAIHSDPSLAIGTAKELVETACKTILSERGTPFNPKGDVPTLAKAALESIKLIPDGATDPTKGAESTRRLLASVAQGVAELRNLYGTGHGRDAKATSVGSVHAALVVGAASAFARFVLEAHWAYPKP